MKSWVLFKVSSGNNWKLSLLLAFGDSSFDLKLNFFKKMLQMSMVKKRKMYLHLRFWLLNKAELDSSLPHLRAASPHYPQMTRSSLNRLFFRKWFHKHKFNVLTCPPGFLNLPPDSGIRDPICYPHLKGTSANIYVPDITAHLQKCPVSRLTGQT